MEVVLSKMEELHTYGVLAPHHVYKILPTLAPLIYTTRFKRSLFCLIATQRETVRTQVNDLINVNEYLMRLFIKCTEIKLLKCLDNFFYVIF